VPAFAEVATALHILQRPSSRSSGRYTSTDKREVTNRVSDSFQDIEGVVLECTERQLKMDLGAHWK
jgi:hypothetical protein